MAYQRRVIGVISQETGSGKFYAVGRRKDSDKWELLSGILEGERIGEKLIQGFVHTNIGLSVKVDRFMGDFEDPAGGVARFCACSPLDSEGSLPKVTPVSTGYFACGEVSWKKKDDFYSDLSDFHKNLFRNF